MFKSSSVFLAVIFLASSSAFRIEQKDELLTYEDLEDLLQEDDQQTLEAGGRVRRDLTDILGMVSSMTDGFKQIPVRDEVCIRSYGSVRDEVCFRSYGSGKITKENSCWASNTLVDCMRNHSYKQCPENRKQQGADCLIKLGKQFWVDLPGKVQKLYDEMKPLFQ
ncbi:hypothetical protein B566_EDAN017823 [Ephemera danica]|nr:hypothetical protein B566_EDAN017823 [Ephemera danica]